MKAKHERNKRLFADFHAGGSAKELAEKYGISAARVREILSDYKLAWKEMLK